MGLTSPLLLKQQPETEDQQQRQPMKIIGVGLGRTGTASLQKALELLGYKTYHMIEAIQNMKHLNMWADISENNNTTTVEDTIFDAIAKEGYNATVDYPMVDYYIELMNLYPNAKFILTVRDNSSAWVKSWRVLTNLAQLTEENFHYSYPNFLQYTNYMKKLHSVRCNMGTKIMSIPKCDLVLNTNNKSDEWLAEQYEKHNNKVIQTFTTTASPSDDEEEGGSRLQNDKLLIFNVKEGWEPLCKFLELSKSDCPPAGNPDLPFPWVNDTKSIKRLETVIKVLVYAWIPCLCFALYIIFKFARRFIRRRQNNPNIKKD